MNIKEKEIIYKLQSKGFEIYKDNENEKFLITKHICKCKENWFTNKKQCIFCGSLGYNIKICKDMHISKLAAKSKSCSEPDCKISGEDLEIGCINPECSSNTSKEIKEIVNKITDAKSKSKGIFSPKSPFTVTQVNCFFCGEKTNQFVSEELDIHIVETEENLKKIIKKTDKILIVNFQNKFLTKINNEDDEIEFQDNIDLQKISEKLYSQLFV